MDDIPLDEIQPHRNADARDWFYNLYRDYQDFLMNVTNRQWGDIQARQYMRAPEVMAMPVSMIGDPR